jgi:hypothetical protein
VSPAQFIGCLNSSGQVIFLRYLQPVFGTACQTKGVVIPEIKILENFHPANLRESPENRRSPVPRPKPWAGEDIINNGLFHQGFHPFPNISNLQIKKKSPPKRSDLEQRN